MENLNRAETTEFLEIFLKGLLEVGLLEPLQRLQQSEMPRIKSAAHSLHAALVAGVTPQVAIGLMAPRFHPTVESLIISVFEQSNIDFILRDIVSAHRSFEDNGQLDKAFEDLLERYSPLKTEAICIECWSNEIQKFFKRANVEQSAQVILSWENGYLVQKFIAAKLVTITEPAIPAVYLTLKKTVSDFAKQGVQNSLNIDVTNISKNQYQMTSKSQTLIVSFVD